MKLFNVALASLFWTASNATIEIEDLPSHVHVGSTYNVSWFNDRDYVSQHTALRASPDSIIDTNTATSKSKTLPSSIGKTAKTGPLASERSITTSTQPRESTVPIGKCPR
jgi:hypothetical protein